MVDVVAMSKGRKRHEFLFLVSFLFKSLQDPGRIERRKKEITRITSRVTYESDHLRAKTDRIQTRVQACTHAHTCVRAAALEAH